MALAAEVGAVAAVPQAQVTEVVTLAPTEARPLVAQSELVIVQSHVDQAMALQRGGAGLLHQ